MRSGAKPVIGAAAIVVASVAGSFHATRAYQDETIVQEAYLKAFNTQAFAEFGYAVAIDGTTAVVGARFEGSSDGAAHVFVRGAAGWTQQAHLKASDTANPIQFGTAVAISGDTIVVGAPNHGPGGAAYVFVRSGTTWSGQQILKASNFAGFDAFGTSVSVSGDTIVVGAHQEDSNAIGVNGDEANNSALESGAAYVFVRNGGVWTQQAYLKASNTEQNDNFGFSVAVSGNTVVVGAFRESSNTTDVDGVQDNNSATQAGAAYVFARSGTTWMQQAYLKPSNTATGGVFGSSVAISSENTVVVGAPVQPLGGAAYVFVRGSSGAWFQEAHLEASNVQSGDQFGRAVGISGNVIVVGAIQEDSNGINGNQADNSLSGAGASYVFVRSGGSWSQHSYLKASNPGFLDGFGNAVAVSATAIIVGASVEDSNATVVNGDQTNNSASQSGAAYVFRFPNTAPTITGGSLTRWPNTSGTVAIATVADADDSAGTLAISIQSANPSNGVTLSNVTNTGGTVTADVNVAPGASDTTFVLRVTDSFGASVQGNFDVTIVPAVTITPVVSPSPNLNGWHNGPVTVSWTVANSTTQSGCDPTVLSSETTAAGTTLTCTAANAGGSLSDSATVRIDTTAPTGTASRTPEANPNGWNNTDVTVTFTCSDALSGVVAAGASDTVSTDGSSQSRAFSCADLAGNAVPLSVTGINIDKTPPTVVAASLVAAPNPAIVNATVSLTASVTDSGPSNLSRAEYRIDTSPYALLAPASTASATVTGSVGSFAIPDVMEICVRAVDLAGNESLEECTYIAVFDPSAGYVTGAGTIDSPPGALVGSAASGTARFGFQSKYAKGANVPSGNTSFKFRAGDLEFDSTSYQWLVVAGARAQFKGSGVIRHQTGTFDFILTVVDGHQPGGGDVDKFRIKITGSTGIVYDNQMGAADSDDPTTALAGGHIVIRK